MTPLERILSSRLDLWGVAASDLSPHDVGTLAECLGAAWADPKLPIRVDHATATARLGGLANWMLLEGHNEDAPKDAAIAQISWKPRFLQSETDKSTAKSFVDATDMAGITNSDRQRFRFAHPAIFAYYYAAQSSAALTSHLERCDLDSQGALCRPRRVVAAMYRLWLFPATRSDDIWRVRSSNPLVSAFIISRAPHEFTPDSLKWEAKSIFDRVDWKMDTQTQAFFSACLSRLACAVVDAVAVEVLTARWRHPTSRLMAAEYLDQHGTAEHLDAMRVTLADPQLCGHDLEVLRHDSEHLPKTLLTESELASAEAKRAFKELGVAALSIFGGYMKVVSTPDFKQGSTWHKMASLNKAHVPMPQLKHDALTRDRENRARIAALPKLIAQAEERRQSIEPRLRSGIEAAIMSVERRQR